MEMMETGMISVRQVIDDLLEHPMMDGLTTERAVNHAAHFLRIVGMPNMFTRKVATVKIRDHKGAMPCDMHKVTQVALRGERGRHHAMRAASSTFHMTPDKADDTHHDITYMIQGNTIITSFRDGDVDVSYEAMPLDKDGFPMIPDDSAMIRAVELYIKKIWFTTLFDMGKISANVLEAVKQDYAWAVGQAQTGMIRPDIDTMQTITNSVNTMIRDDSHATMFRHEGGTGRKRR